jgi:leucyl-tRNA synthetase
VVQVNGKVRDRLTAPVSVTEDEAKKLAMALDKVKPFVEGKQIVKVIYVPKKLISIVVK